MPDIHKEKIYAARSTGPLKASEDPFVSLGHDRLFHIESLFPTRLQEWDAKTPQEHRTGHIEGHPPIMPNPALVPNHVLHRDQRERHEQRQSSHSSEMTKSSPAKQDGRTLIAFTPMHTGADQYGSEYTSQATTSRQQSAYPSRETTPTPSRPKPSGSAPPWADIRGAMPAPSLSRPSPPQPPRPVRIPRAGRKYVPTSIGGSPPSSLEDEPLLRHVAPASRTHVIRPPAFADGETRPVSTDTLIAIGGTSIPGWTGRVAQGVLKDAARQNQTQPHGQPQPQNQNQQKQQQQHTRQPLRPQEQMHQAQPRLRGRLDEHEMPASAKVHAWRQFEVSSGVGTKLTRSEHIVHPCIEITKTW